MIIGCIVMIQLCEKLYFRGETILEWFVDKVDKGTGMLGAIPHWNFVDWPTQWPWSKDKPTGGVPPGGMTGGSSILTLQLAYTLKMLWSCWIIW